MASLDYDEPWRVTWRNALRANLVDPAEDWRWSSLWRREKGSVEMRFFLSEWPVKRQENRLSRVNQPKTEAELEALRRRAQRGRPSSSRTWLLRTAKELGLESTLRSAGWPKK